MFVSGGGVLRNGFEWFFARFSSDFEVLFLVRMD